MNKTRIDQEVKLAQFNLDKILPGLVKVSVVKDADGGSPSIEGKYMDYKFGKSVNAEPLDRFYSMDIFLSFFRQRKEYMLASKEDQLAFDGHPAMYNMA